jgi:hypothetical protein
VGNGSQARSGSAALSAFKRSASPGDRAGRRLVGLGRRLLGASDDVICLEGCARSFLDKFARACARVTGYYRSDPARPPCRCKALAIGRCKFHGGLSTGPKTAEGQAKIAEAQRKRWAARRQEASGQHLSGSAQLVPRVAEAGRRPSISTLFKQLRQLAHDRAGRALLDLVLRGAVLGTAPRRRRN